MPRSAPLWWLCYGDWRGVLESHISAGGVSWCVTGLCALHGSVRRPCPSSDILSVSPGSLLSWPRPPPLRPIGG